MNKKIAIGLTKMCMSMFTGIVLGKAALPSIKKAFNLPVPPETIVDFNDIPEEELYDDEE